MQNQDRQTKPECESHEGSRTKFTCDMRKPLHSADYLQEDCKKDVLPGDAEVIEHFGFHRFPLMQDRAKLLGLYQGLFLLDITPDQLNSWRLNGTLLENMKATFSKVPEGIRGGYFPWFLKHQYCLDDSKTGNEVVDDLVHTFYDEARLHLEPEERNIEIDKIRPPFKRIAFDFLAWTLHGYGPPPPYTNSYYEFGFCTCLGEPDEARLGDLYRKLLVGDKSSSFETEDLNLHSSNHRTCTFVELWQALEAGKLTNLMDSKGFELERRKFRHLDTFLAHPYHGPRSSVWNLQAFLNDKKNNEPSWAVSVDYGFENCKGSVEVQELKSIYRRILALSDPLALHDACVAGQLFDFAKSLMELEPRLKKTMRNPYPLSPCP